MEVKIMAILAEIIMALRLLKSVDKDNLADVVCNLFVFFTFCLLSRM